MGVDSIIENDFCITELIPILIAGCSLRYHGFISTERAPFSCFITIH